MVNVHMSARKYKFLHKYDSLLISRKHRYTMFFTFPYRDYFVYKIINKLMSDGKKWLASHVSRQALIATKQAIGFQPFFLFKHISYSMRQLFKIQKTIVRQQKEYYLPLLLKPHNQVTYGINHLILCAKQLAREDKISIANAPSIVFLNSFISVSN
jgi:ribosomal protein S7